MRINNRGFWEDKIAPSNHLGSAHKFDAALCAYMLHMFADTQTMVDFGCGNADYTHRFKNQGMSVRAFDGNPNTPEMTNGLGSVLDLTTDFDLGCQFGLTLMLEVAEHIPAAFEQAVLTNVVRHVGGDLVLSWAIPGQCGDGHVNERGNAYVIDRVQGMGLSHCPYLTSELRKHAEISWFKNTLFFFHRG